jgi:hypothetical protein
LAESVNNPLVVAYVTRPLVNEDKLKLAPAIVPVSVGLADKTLLPVPVFVTETTFLLASKANAVDAVSPDNVVVDDVESVVNAPVDAVVAPTVPFNAPANLVAVTVVPSHVKLDEPPNEPLLLNCTFVLEPPIEPVLLVANT